MALVVKSAPFNSLNVGLNDLHDTLNHVIKSKKYSSYKEAVKSINKHVLDDDLTTEYKTSSIVSTDTDTIPDLTDNTTNNLIRVGTTIYNKDFYEEETILFKFINPYFNNDIVYCCNYKNEIYNYCINKFNMFFCSNKPCLLMDIAPFTLAQYYTLLDNIGYTC